MVAYRVGRRRRVAAHHVGWRAVFVENTSQGFDDRSDVGTGEGIINGLRLAPRLDQPVPSETGQMLRQRRLAEADNLLQLADAVLAVSQLAKDKQAMPVAHGLQQDACCLQVLLNRF